MSALCVTKLLTPCLALPIVALIHSQLVPAQLKLGPDHQEVEEDYNGLAHHQGAAYKNL